MCQLHPWVSADPDNSQRMKINDHKLIYLTYCHKLQSVREFGVRSGRIGNCTGSGPLCRQPNNGDGAMMARLLAEMRAN
jgi:hypothetical protein